MEHLFGVIQCGDIKCGEICLCGDIQCGVMCLYGNIVECFV